MIRPCLARQVGIRPPVFKYPRPSGTLPRAGTTRRTWNHLAQHNGHISAGGAIPCCSLFVQRNQKSFFIFQDNVDRINLTAHGFSGVNDALALASQVGTDVVFNFGGGHTLTVKNVTLAQLQNDIVV